MRIFFIVSLILFSFVSEAQITRKTFIVTKEYYDSMMKISKNKDELRIGFNGVKYKLSSKQLHHAIDSITKIPIDTLQNRFIRSLNVYRKKNNLAPVVYDVECYNSAKFIADYNLTIPKLSHITNIKGYETLTDRNHKFITVWYKHLGENLLTGYLSLDVAYSIVTNITFEETILARWIMSPAHNSNLLLKSASKIGVVFNKYLIYCMVIY